MNLSRHGNQREAAAPFGKISAELYDTLYGAKNYGGEAAWIAQLRDIHAPDADSLLDVACGTGAHLQHLQEYFSSVAGVDLSEAQVALAQKRLPQEVDLREGDMRNFDFRRRFGVVACLFASISHLSTYEALRQGMNTMARHVSPGVFL